MEYGNLFFVSIGGFTLDYTQFLAKVLAERGSLKLSETH